MANVKARSQAAGSRGLRVKMLLGLGLGLGLAMGQTGCGDPLVDEQFRGAPIWSTQGELKLGQGQTRQLAVRVALFWNPAGTGSNDVEQHVEQIDSGLSATVPSIFRMNVYQPPGPAHRVHLQGGGDAGYAAGRMLVYADQNGNGRRDPGETFLSAEATDGYFYAARPLTAAESPLGRPMAAGFHALWLPQRCAAKSPQPETAGMCGVPLGVPCHGNLDCGGTGMGMGMGLAGRCFLDEGNKQWQNGACVVTDDFPCHPASATWIPFPPPPDAGPHFMGFYVRSCATDADCDRPMDHSQGNYRCDPGMGGCVPSDLPRFDVGTTLLGMPRFCQQ